MDVIVNSVVTLSIMGFVFAAGLAVASKKFAVEVDERQEAILGVLPGANCGGCGYPGCAGLAAAIVAGDAPVNGCPVGGAGVAEKVAGIMGVEAQTGVRNVANVHCNGTNENAVEKAKYIGIADCRAATIAQGGSKGCTFGCMGLGSCVKVCQFDSIYIGTDGVAHVDKEKCTACGKCIEVCPKSIIAFIPENQQVYINCSSHDKGKDVKSICQVGCIGCGICAKNCPFEAIEMVNDLPVINYEKCKQCNICVNKCPTKAIKGRVIAKKAAPAQKTAPAAEQKAEPAQKADASQKAESEQKVASEQKAE